MDIESGSQEILNDSLKDTKVEWVEPACRLVKDAGIDVGAFWIIGLPGATREREEKSLTFLDRLIEEGLIDDLEAHVFVPLPGSTARLSKRVSKNIRYDADIDESSRKSYFDSGATYEHTDEKGEVVLSKADVKDLKDEYDKRVLALKRK